MRTSENINEIAAALAKAQGAIAGAVKDSTNPHFRSGFASLASVMDALREPFAAHGLSYVQPLSTAENAVVVTTRLMHSSGQWLEESLAVPLAKNDAQGLGSAATYGRRYTLSAMGGIAQVDDDGNAATASGPVEKLVSTAAPKPEAAPTPLEISDALMALAEVAPSGMEAVQAEMEGLRPALQAHLRQHEKAKLASIKKTATTPVKEAAEVTP